MLDPDFLEPERLRAFVAVAETSNFTRAAKRLHLTQPAVSIQVRRLEDAIGRPLFDRRGQSVHLTPDGETLLAHARELLATMSRVRCQFAQPPLTGSVRFGLVDDFNTVALPEILDRLRRQHARFELLIESDSSANLLAQFHAGSLDLVLAKRVAGGSQGEFLYRQQLVWVGQPEVLARENNVVPLVLRQPKSTSREIILQSLREAGRPWSLRLESASSAGLRAAVLAGLGVTTFGLGVIPPDLVPLPPGTLPPLADAEYVLLQPPGRKAPLISALADLLRTAAPLVLARLEEEQRETMPNLAPVSATKGCVS